MEPDPMQACVTALQQAGWHVAPAANPWHVITEIHADRWWSPQLLDTAVLSITTGQGLFQRLQLEPATSGPGLPQHQVVASSGLQPFDDLVRLLPIWSTPPSEAPDAGQEDPSAPPG